MGIQLIEARGVAKRPAVNWMAPSVLLIGSLVPIEESSDPRCQNIPEVEAFWFVSVCMSLFPNC